MITAGVIAYYTSPTAARYERARPIVAAIHAELRALLRPTLAIMRTWRLAKRVRAWRPRTLSSTLGGELEGAPRAEPRRSHA